MEHPTIEELWTKYKTDCLRSVPREFLLDSQVAFHSGSVATLGTIITALNTMSLEEFNKYIQSLLQEHYDFSQVLKSSTTGRAQ